jgi:hypothetical protein
VVKVTDAAPARRGAGADADGDDVALGIAGSGGDGTVAVDTPLREAVPPELEAESPPALSIAAGDC